MNLCHVFIALFTFAPILQINGFGFGALGGCCGCMGRKKRSVDDQEMYRFHADDNDKLCNSPELKRLIRKNMARDPLTSKANLVKALSQEGDHFFVVCSTGESSYTAPRSALFCSSASNNHTCYVFGL